MLKTGIVSIASYIPRNRLRAAEIGKFWGGGGGGEHAVCAADEDAVTMAVAAADKLLAQTATSIDKIDFIAIASTSSPYAEQPASHVVALALGAREDISTADHGGSPRAATTALLDCVGAIESGRARTGIVICSDCRQAEPSSELEKSLGAGAVALLVGQDKVSFAIEATTGITDLFVDKWREDGGQFVKEYDTRFNRQHGVGDHVAKVVAGLLEKAQLAAEDFARVAISQSFRGYADNLKKLQFKPEHFTDADVLSKYGDLGSASAFLSLRQLGNIEKGQRVLLVNYGAGGAEALALHALQDIKGGGDDDATPVYLSYDQYLKITQLVRRDYVIPPLSVPPISPYMWRSRREMLQLVANKCKCGTVNFPASLRRICIKCGASDGFTEVKLGRRGHIHTHTFNYYMPDGFDVPLPFVVADMDDGTRYGAMGSGLDVATTKIGDPVRLALRKFSAERGVSTYGYKFVNA